MKTLKISDELFEELKAISLTINNHGNDKPYYFQIIQKQRIYGMVEENSDGFVYVDFDNPSEYLEPEVFDQISSEKIDKSRFDKRYYKFLYSNDNCFLTELGAKSHVEKRVYPQGTKIKRAYAYGNPEMQAVFNLLNEISTQ